MRKERKIYDYIAPENPEKIEREFFMNDFYEHISFELRIEVEHYIQAWRRNTIIDHNVRIKELDEKDIDEFVDMFFDYSHEMSLL